MDKVSADQRSRNMAAVRSHDTKPEKVVRSILHSLGLRFRLHQRSLPGSPDIVLRRHGAVVLVHGCFWHGHECRRGKMPSSRQDFWIPKLAGNRERDARQVRELNALGWRVLTIWECEVKDVAKLSRRLARCFKVASIT
jgi:DNA mismatch endonuclease, patch repair protein